MLLLKQHTGLNSMIILSMVGHILAITSILYYESLSRERLVSVPPIYTVRLVTSKPARKKVFRKRVKPKSMTAPDKPAVKNLPDKYKSSVKEAPMKVMTPPPVAAEDIPAKIELPVSQAKKLRRSSDKLQMALKSSEMRIKTREKERVVRDLFSNLRTKNRIDLIPRRSKKEADKRILAKQPPIENVRAGSISKSIERMKLEDRLSSEQADIKQAFRGMDKESPFKEEPVIHSKDKQITALNERREPAVEDQMKRISDTQEGIRIMEERLTRIKEAFSGIRSSEKRRSARTKSMVTEGREMTVSYKIPEEQSELPATVKRLSSMKGAMTGSVAREVAVTVQNIIRSRVEAAWELDEYMARRGDYVSLNSIVLLRVAPDGKITRTTVLKLSENRVFHESVLKAIEESDPLLIGRFNLADSFEVELNFSPSYR